MGRDVQKVVISFDVKMQQSLHCETCDYTGKNKQDLKKHAVSHSVNKSACNECGKIFSNSRGLNLHIKVHTKSELAGSGPPVVVQTIEAEAKINRTPLSKKSKKTSSKDVDSPVKTLAKKEDSVKKSRNKSSVIKPKLDATVNDDVKLKEPKPVLNLAIIKDEKEALEIKDLDIINKEPKPEKKRTKL